MRRAALILLAPLILAACGDGGGEPAPATQGTAAAPPAPLTEAERATRLASLPAPYNTADMVNGKRQFGKCRSCHTIVPGGPTLTGPNLYGVFGRKSGSVPGYNYSEALKTAGWTWDAERLDGWLAQPRTYLPGTKMTFVGIKDEQDRRDLIGYLKVETGYETPTGAPTAP